MTQLTKSLGIQYPLIQGSMAHISKHQLVIAVSNAGGLGVLTSAGLTADELRNEIHLVREGTTKPFAVNLMLMMPNIPELVSVIVDEKVPIVITGAGTPKAYMPALLASDVKVIPVIPSVKLAQKMETLGASAVIAEGMESGGHIGEMTTMALVPQVVSAINIPVIAAGGIGDGRGIVAAFALGAQAVQLGTIFLTAEETPIAADFKQAIITATDTATAVSGRHTGIPVRSLHNNMIETYLELERRGATRDEFEDLTTGSLLKAIHGDIENGTVMAGQIAGLISDIRPASQIVTDLMADAQLVLTKLHL